MDRNTPKRGGRVIPFIRRLPIWGPFRKYFPAKVELVIPKIIVSEKIRWSL